MVVSWLSSVILLVYVFGFAHIYANMHLCIEALTFAGALFLSISIVAKIRKAKW